MTEPTNKQIIDRIEVFSGHLTEHAKSDKIWQDRLEPMVKLFEENEITKMKIKQSTGTIVFYVKSGTYIATFLVGLWYVIQWMFKNLPR